jgi:hypothetical protein
MSALDVTQFREVPFATDGRPRDPADLKPEIVRSPGGGLYTRSVTYYPHIPDLDLPDRTSPLLAHALRPEWWSAWFCRGEGKLRHRVGPAMAPERIAKLAELVGDTAGDDERIAWGIVNLEHRVVLPMVCDLARLHTHAQKIRSLPILGAANIAGARRVFRQLELAAERIAPWIPVEDRSAPTEVESILDGAERSAGLKALTIAMIGCDVKTGEGGWFGPTVPHDAGEWPAVRRVRDAEERATCDADFPVYRAAGKVATREQAERFSEHLHALVEEFLRDLPRSRRRSSRKEIRS